jgi:hypothetical protein
MSASLERIKRWFRRTTGGSVADAVEGESPVATPPPGADDVGMGVDERETSTNAQMECAADEPWPGNR